MKLSRGYHSHHYSSAFLFLLFVSHSFGLNSDGSLLLSFKYSILSDPLSVLDSWDYNDETPCLWNGVICAQVEASPGNPDVFRVVSLALPDSKLLGSIPEDLGFIPYLRTLDLSGNFLNGTLPSSLFNASELQGLSLSSNAIYGGLPGGFGGMKSLKVLNLSDNALAGEIPEKMSSLRNLSVVSLRSNYFSGGVPGGFQFVEMLDLSSNLLNGSLPEKFGGENLKYLNLSSNRLSGLLSPGFAEKIPANATVDLSFNNLTGEIPESMALSNQKTEFFAGNVDLCGKPLKKLCTIPSTLSSPPNVSTNTSPPAIAAIPKTIGSTPVPSSGGAAQDQPPQHGLKPGTMAGIVVGDLAGLGLLALVFLYVYQLKKKKKKANEEENIKETKDQKFNKTPEIISVKETTKSLPTWPCLTIITNGEETETSDDATASDSDDNTNNHPTNQDAAAADDDDDHELVQKNKKPSSLVMIDRETQLDLETLLKASAYILGSSGASIVYKAVLEDGTAFAVRRIGESGVKKMKEFEHQVKAIAKLRHPNLVRVRGFYWGEDEKLVIYDYVSNGSLANVGFRKVGSSPYHLPFEVRVKIAKGVAKGIAFIHDKKHVHGNIKPSNVLLSPEMEAAISDFGLHWLLYGKTNHYGNKTDNSSRHFGSRRSTPSYGLPDGGHPVQCSSPYIAAAGFMGCTSPYHAPESLKDLKPNPKWDVYSFGIVLLELLTGKMFSDRELSQWTATGSVAENKDRVLRMADVSIRADVESRQQYTLALFKLGFECASLDPKKRPSMKDALHVIDSIPCSSSSSYL
ncbi:PREDICTED: probable LRR receptor-like serine/threonine-protein kinase At4g37250 [Ipomoea nil]|uniref:probable LRR receptor-like serine/threonine-protein kinase At4g37250 n=1 Tax=Ipomoea nil TaxID=35883 RepID=UPI000900F8DA|nr:PREDICTED: probable LRR receptor-like serine/threonine-protein kinase At4g37250 [Ipomoea nil]